MEIEKITQAGSYKSAEPVKQTVSRPEVSVNNSTILETATPVVAQSGKTGGNDSEKNGKEREHQPSEASIDDAVRSANRRMDRTRCEYSYHKATKRVSIKVIDDDTDEVIREIPPEKSLDMLQKMWEMAGILVDERR